MSIPPPAGLRPLVEEEVGTGKRAGWGGVCHPSSQRLLPMASSHCPSLTQCGKDVPVEGMADLMRRALN